MPNEIFKSLPDAMQPKPAAQADDGVPEEFRGKVSKEGWEAIQSKANAEWQAREDQLRREYEEKMKAGAAPAPRPAPYQPPAPFSPKPVNEEEEPNLLLDPERYMERQFSRRMQPLVEQQAMAMRSQNSQLFRMNEPDFYSKYGEEIEGIVSQMAPQMQANPQVYRMAATLVRGNHYQEIAEEIATKRLSERGFQPEQPAQQAEPQRGFFGGSVRPPVSERPAPSGQSSKKVIKLTDEEKKYAEMFNMTPEEYLEYKGQNTDQLTMLRDELGRE